MNTLNPASGPAHDLHHHNPSFIKKYIFSTDHKMIGVQFLITTLIMMMLGGALALGIRWQLAWPWHDMPVFGSLFAGEGGQGVVTSAEGFAQPIPVPRAANAITAILVHLIITPFQIVFAESTRLQNTPAPSGKPAECAKGNATRSAFPELPWSAGARQSPPVRSLPGPRLRWWPQSIRAGPGSVRGA